MDGRHKNNSSKQWTHGELYGRHKKNSPKDGELNGWPENNSPKEWTTQKVTRQRDSRMES